MYNLENVEETNGNLYIEPGINEVVIEGFEKKANRFGDEVIEVRFKTVDGSSQLVDELHCAEEGNNGKEAPVKFALIKIRHIARAIIGEENLNQLTGNTLDELVASCNQHLIGKPYRQKFGGVEVISNSKSWDKAVIPMPSTKAPMAEPLSIPNEETKLSYSKENSYDYRRKATQPATGLPPVPGTPMTPTGQVPPHLQPKQ